ncbi:MAG TPA: sigma 54-interacting transcriptional regulator [Balneolaceae bacterium]|nr:sigma 54-interacting transcriptional regulator [Balneolaceae bacterium]
MNHKKITTLGELKKSGWTSSSVKDEMRRNLLTKIKKKESLFPGIMGYDNTVVPQVKNAILARHDLILLGLRGQAKTKMLRMLVAFLDEYIPVVKGSEVNDDPLQPVSKFAVELIDKHGDDTPIEWLHRERRYGEKLATPDTSVADIIGDLDPIKAASKKLALADEEVINFGLIPRTNRGIFVINELPDLQPRIQVALLNIMQERDIQIRGFNVRIPLDVSIAFSANPEDYTNRGNIITPLKDRIDSQIITHYPRELSTGIKITEQEAWTSRNGAINVRIPDLYRTIIENVAFEARKSEYIDQKSGVSTRMTITAMEQIISSAESRAALNGEEETDLRVTDLYAMVPALTGKLELVYEGEQEGAVNVAKHIIGKAINKTFKEYFSDPQSRKRETKSGDYDTILNWFSNGNLLELPSSLNDNTYKNRLDEVDGLGNLVESALPELSDSKYPIMDMVIEALHQNSKIGKDDIDDVHTYTDMLGSMLGGMTGFDDEDFNEDDPF